MKLVLSLYAKLGIDESHKSGCPTCSDKATPKPAKKICRRKLAGRIAANFGVNANTIYPKGSKESKIKQFIGQKIVGPCPWPRPDRKPQPITVEVTINDPHCNRPEEVDEYFDLVSLVQSSHRTQHSIFKAELSDGFKRVDLRLIAEGKIGFNEKDEQVFANAAVKEEYKQLHDAVYDAVASDPKNKGFKNLILSSLATGAGLEEFSPSARSWAYAWRNNFRVYDSERGIALPGVPTFGGFNQIKLRDITMGGLMTGIKTSYLSLRVARAAEHNHRPRLGGRRSNNLVIKIQVKFDKGKDPLTLKGDFVIPPILILGRDLKHIRFKTVPAGWSRTPTLKADLIFEANFKAPGNQSAGNIVCGADLNWNNQTGIMSCTLPSSLPPGLKIPSCCKVVEDRGKQFLHVFRDEHDSQSIVHLNHGAVTHDQPYLVIHINDLAGFQSRLDRETDSERKLEMRKRLQFANEARKNLLKNQAGEVAKFLAACGYSLFRYEGFDGSEAATDLAAGSGRQRMAPFTFRNLVLRSLSNYGIQGERVPARNSTRGHYYCGFLNSKETVGCGRYFTCAGCGELVNRDCNSALNIAEGGFHEGVRHSFESSLECEQLIVAD